MKRLVFSEDLECLVDEKNYQKYEGKRFKTVTAWAGEGSNSPNRAEQEVRQKVEDLAIKYKAEAYELISVNTFDSKREYDSRPYTATATALLYKSK